MAQKDVGNKVPIYKLKKTDEVMKYYDEWGEGNKYDQDMIDWNYTGPKETSEVFIKYQKNKDAKIYDAGCGTGLVGVELKKYGFSNFYGADLSQKLLDLVPTGLYQKLNKVDLNKVIEEEDNFYEVTTEANVFNNVLDVFKEKKIEYIDAQLTLRADTLVPLDNDMSEKVLNIMEFMDDLDDVQEVHTNAEFPDNFEVKE